MDVLFNLGSADTGRPSFFEMYIQAQMMPSLKPAMKYLLAIASQRFPRLTVTHKYADEIFYGILFVLERHFLRHYDGSFSENFYGLKRAPVGKERGQRLPFLKQHRYMSLVFLVIIPYLKEKMDQWYNRNYAHDVTLLQAGDVENFRSSAALNTGLRGKMTTMLRILYPSFHAAYEGSHFIYQLLYLYDYTSYFTPFLHLMGLRVSRLSMNDIQLQTQRAYLRTAVHTNDPPLVRAFWGFIHAIGAVVDFSKYLLPMAVFFFNFLEWWYRDANKSGITEQEPVPPPPEPPRTNLSELKLEDRTLCPICKKTRTNPAMLPSGFVFCYTCIHPYVQEHERCPVTRMPYSVDRIRRVFDESSE